MLKWSTVSSRQALAAALRFIETVVAALRRDSSRLLGRAELHVRAWREALDPTTSAWVAGARARPAEKDAEQVRRDLQDRIEQARCFIASHSGDVPRRYGRTVWDTGP